MRIYLMGLSLAIFVYILLKHTGSFAPFKIKNSDSLFVSLRKDVLQELPVSKEMIFVPDIGHANKEWPPEKIKTQRDIYEWLSCIQIKLEGGRIISEAMEFTETEYDFRTIATDIDKYISKIKASSTKITLIGHGLGCMLINLLLCRQTKNWKEEHIEKVVYISPNLGGFPKALSVILSGENVRNIERPFFRSVVRNFSGLLLCLPNPDIYEEALLKWNNELYYAKDIPFLLSETGADDTRYIYETYCLPLQRESMGDPQVKIEIYSAKPVERSTPVFFEYEELLDEPTKIKYGKGDSIIPEKYQHKGALIRGSYYTILSKYFYNIYIDAEDKKSKEKGRKNKTLGNK